MRANPRTTINMMNKGHYRKAHLRGRLVNAASDRHEPKKSHEKHGKGQRANTQQ